MQRFGWLIGVFSTFSRYQLRNEGIPREKLLTNPWLHTPLVLKWRLGLYHHRLDGAWMELTERRQLAFISKRIPECDIFVALSGSGLTGGRITQQRGGKWICDRASSHMVYVEDLLADEFSRYGMTFQRTDPWFVEKDLIEYQEADHIVVPSESARQSFIAKGIDQSKVTRISFGSDLGTFRRTADPDPDAFTVCYCGQVNFRKGIPYLLDAFRRVKHPKKRLVIVGAIKPEIKKFLSTAHLENVEFLGLLPRAQLPDVYSRANVFAIASLEEGMAMVQTEAMACGVPVIATFNAGASDVIEEGVSGYVVPIRAPQVMAERLQRLADDPVLCRQMGENARRGVELLGGWDSYGNAYRELCLKLAPAAAKSPKG